MSVTHSSNNDALLRAFSGPGPSSRSLAPSHVSARIVASIPTGPSAAVTRFRPSTAPSLSVAVETDEAENGDRGLEGLTVCVTNFRRATYLARCLESLLLAGIRHVVVATVEPDAEVVEVLRRFQGEEQFLSFEVAPVHDDIGCNNTWMLAAYKARTERIIIMHDDDCLTPAFAEAYVNTISPALHDGRANLASWRAQLVYDDKTTQGTEYFSGHTRFLPSQALAQVVGDTSRLSLSPIVSVFDRDTVIDACKESEQCLVHNDCLERPGMLLGTEIVVYLRHCQKFRKWLYVADVLAQYGHHQGSGTVAHQAKGDLSELIRGYNVARAQCLRPLPKYKPKLLLVYGRMKGADEDEQKRDELARQSWRHQFGTFDFIDFGVSAADFPRDSLSLGDSRATHYVRDIFDSAVDYARPGDIICFINRDIGLTIMAADKLLEGVERGSGVTVCPRRRLIPKAGRLYKTVLNCKYDGGFDVMACTKEWWLTHREKMPDMLIGREAWDTVFRTLAEEHADGREMVTSLRNDWWVSKAYTDDVAWHREHFSFWQTERHTGKGQIYNRALARDFFLARHNHPLVQQLS